MGIKSKGDTRHKRSSPPLFYCLAGRCKRSFTRTWTDCTRASAEQNVPHVPHVPECPQRLDHVGHREAVLLFWRLLFPTVGESNYQPINEECTVETLTQTKAIGSPLWMQRFEQWFDRVAKEMAVVSSVSHRRRSTTWEPTVSESQRSVHKILLSCGFNPMRTHCRVKYWLQSDQMLESPTSPAIAPRWRWERDVIGPQSCFRLLELHKKDNKAKVQVF